MAVLVALATVACNDECQVIISRDTAGNPSVSQQCR